MPYRLRRKKAVQSSLRKIAVEQIDRAIGEIDDNALDEHATVHQVRKRCKKLRGLIRLVRPGFADYPAENAFLRDAARRLSPLRDAQSIVDAFEQLVAGSEGRIGAAEAAPVRHALLHRRAQISDDSGETDRRLVACRTCLLELRGRAAHWKIDDDGFAAIGGGLRKTYRRGRKALRHAYEARDSEAFHEWRKRAKYHWYHLRLLRDTWPDMLGVQRDTADKLSDLLGDDHDLAVLGQALHDDAGRFGDVSCLAGIRDEIDRRRAQLQAAARPLGERLYAEKPKRLSARLQRYWASWRSDGVA